MIKAYKLKIYPNKGKAEQLNELLAFWRDEVNRKIMMFWQFKEVKGSYCPTEYAQGGRLVRDASTKAWQIVKSAKTRRQKEEPIFTGDEIDLNVYSGKVIVDFETKEFDFWISVLSTTPRARMKLPCKRYRMFSNALNDGKLKKSFKIKKISGSYYAIFFVEFLDIQAENTQVVGLDVGLNHTVATSDGRFFGDELRELRIKTKWRQYKKGLSAFKQSLNRIAKEIVDAYPKSDFAVEKLLFKGKRGRSKMFRRRNNNWGYSYLSSHLKEMGNVKGFNVFFVDPRDTSRKCPQCSYVDKSNRQGEKFLCIKCGFSNHADTIGALNIALKSREEHSSLKLITQKDI